MDVTSLILVNSEFRKLFSNKIFIICLVLFFFINSVGLYFSAVSDREIKYELSLREDFKEKLSYYLNVDRDVAIAELSNIKQAYQIAANIQSASSESVDSSYVADLIIQYRSDNPNAYMYAQKLIKEGFSAKDIYVAELLLNRFSYIEEYETFINDMQSRRDLQLQFSIFSKQGTFAYKNIEKTPTDFEHLKGIEIIPGFDLGFNLSTSFQLTDYLLIVLVLLICFTLFSLEREKGLTVLIKSTLKGRQHTVIAKLFILVLVVTGITLTFYTANLITSETSFGLGDLNRSIQSIPKFINCTLKCTVLEYLIIWFLQKTVTLCVIALIFAFLFTIIKSNSFIYLIIASFLSVEFYLYHFIDSMSPVNHLKYVNIFYFLSGNELLGNYINLNFFSQPLNVIWTYLFVVGCCTLIFPLLCSVAFSKREQFAGKDISGYISEKIRTKTHIFIGNTSVFRGECYKHYVNSKVLIILIFAVIFAWTSFNEDIDIVYSNGAEVAYATYLNKLEGELTPEKEQFLLEEQNYFDKLDSEKEGIESDSSLSESEKAMRITAINNIIDTRGKGFEKVMQQYDMIKYTSQKINIAPCFINYTLGKLLMMNSSREWTSFSIFMVLIVCSLSGVFAYEHKNKMQRLIRATRKGKGKLVAAKFSVSLLTCFILYTLIYLPFMINYVNTFGTSIFSNPLVFLEGFERLESDISIVVAIVLESFVRLFVSLAVVMLILFLSDKLKSTITAMIVSTSVTLVPCVLIYFYPDLRLFSLLVNNKIWIMILLIVLSIILAGVLAMLTYKSFIEKHKGDTRWNLK